MNMLNIIPWIVLMPIVMYYILKLYKQYNELETIDEKAVFLLFLFILLFPLIFYYLDRYNIFSKLKWVQNIDSDNWFSFIATYVSSIFGAIIGALVLIIMTKYQIYEQDKKDKEIVRINNMPLLTYKLNRNKGNNYSENLLVTNSNNDDGTLIDFELVIKNVGLNTIKKGFIVFFSEDFPNSYPSCLENNGCIGKNENVTIYHYVRLSKGKHIITFIIYYCDLINNWYCQEVKLNFEITNTFDENGNIYSSNIIVEDEKLLKEPPEILANIMK